MKRMNAAQCGIEARSFAERGPFSARFLSAVLFALSAFIMSNDNSLKIASVSVSSFATFIMIAVFLADSLGKGDFILKTHPLQRPLFLIFLWAGASLLIALIMPSKDIPYEAYSFPWATG